jgi:hypothetical protein
VALRYTHSKSEGSRLKRSPGVTQWVLALVSDEKTTAVSIRDSECGHPAGGGNETVIFLMRTGEPTTRLKIAKPIQTVSQAEVVDALTPPTPT